MNVYQSILLTKRPFKGEEVPGGTVADPPPPTEFYTYTVTNDSELTAALAAAVPGDVIGMMSGYYRNTYTTANSGTAGLPITIQAVAGQTPIVSGFNEIGTTGWTVHSGQVYKKTITLPVNGFNTSTTRVFGLDNNNTTIYANQIIRNDEMMFEARWPKIASVADLMTWTKYRQLSYPTFGVNSLTDASLPIAAPGLVGATLVSNGWFPTETKTITAHSGNTISYGGIWSASGTGQWPRKAYYVTGKLALLTDEKEWHYESGTLYFRQPGGGTPSGTIEYKARNWGFNLRGKSHIKIKGLTFRGCDPVVMNTSDTNITVDRTKARYNNHYVRHDVQEWQGVGMSKMFGTKLIGSNCVFTNNEWSVMGMGVWCGENFLGHNNLMHDIGYVGNWAHPFSLWQDTGGQTFTYNTIYNCGRSCIDFGWNVGGYAVSGVSLNVTIAYNHMYNFGMISSDVGATYAWGQRILTGLNYHHNWIHDCLSRNVIGEGGLVTAIYFDQASGGGRVHHNVTWNVQNSDVYHETINEHRSTNTLIDFYNNTFDGNNGIEPSADSAYRTYHSTPLDVQRNNIYKRKIVINWIAGYNGNTSNSIYTGTNALFVGGDRNTIGGLYYQLQAGSPARGIGLGSFTGATGLITDSDTDAGAYQYGDPDPWVPGYTAIVDNPEVPTEFYIDNVGPANVYTGSWLHVANAAWNENHINKTVSVATAAEATVQTSFSGSRIEWYSEKRENHAIAAVSIDGGAETLIDLYEARTDNNSTLVFAANVSPGNHVIKLRLTNTKNPSSTGNPFPLSMVHDAFRVTPATEVLGVLATGVWNDSAYYDDDTYYKD